jgi:hypothetical protein
MVHDLRRSAANAFQPAAVPGSVIMEIGGWKIESVFRCRAIVSPTDGETRWTNWKGTGPEWMLRWSLLRPSS